MSIHSYILYIIYTRFNNTYNIFQFFLGPEDLSQTLIDGPKQPNLQEYPTTRIGNRNRSFQKDWYKRYDWLEYSVLKDKAYCFYCRFFQISPENDSKDAFISEGFRSWKKALEQNAGLRKHAASENHKHCVIKYTEYLKLHKCSKSVMTMVNEAHAKLIQENKHYLKTVADCLLLTCKLEIAQKGHDESSSSLNQGNFREIMTMLSKHDPIISSRLIDGPKNAQYLHHDIQNSLIKIMVDQIKFSIANEIEEAKYFAVMADETKDLSKQEQVSVVIRYYYKGAIYERFMGFCPAEKLDAISMSDLIKNTILIAGLDLHNCVAQAYDGANVMSGHLNGVQAKIKQFAPNAAYIHCFNHALNLVIVDCCKSNKDSFNFFRF